MIEASFTPKNETTPSRPKAWLKTIAFNSGLQLTLAKHEIVVIVGPNNVGKSLVLRELQRFLQSGGAPGLLIQDIGIEGEGIQQDALNWAQAISPKTSPTNADDPFRLPFGHVHQSHVPALWHNAMNGLGFGNMLPIVAVHFSTDGRLQLAQDVASINFVTERPTAPLQHLYEDEKQETKLSRLFKLAFGHDLIVNRFAGSQITLHFGKRPQPPAGKDRLSNEYREAVHGLPTVSSQGDGIRAFVGLLLHTLVSDRDIFLIDEPEAFLHPPQAKLLGRILATETPHPRQLIVATHSSDFLKGLLDDPKSPIRVVRIERSDSDASVAELRPELVREAWRDPVLRYSGLFDGLFHRGVIVCESDSDCRFYGAMMDAVAREEASPDLLLVQGAGKARTPVMVEALRAIKVPVRTIFDFDVLADETVLKRTFEALGGVWFKVASDWRTVKAGIESKRPELQTKDVREKIAALLVDVTQSTLPKEKSDNIREILRSASAWSEAKKSGKAFVPRGEQTAAYERLVAKLRTVGIYIVEVGELEGFCPSIGGHGPSWTVKVLERDLSNDPELEGARTFARLLLSDW